MYLPNTANPDNRSEPGGEGVSAEGRARVYRRHYLHVLQPHPLQIAVIETTICQYLNMYTSDSDDVMMKGISSFWYSHIGNRPVAGML